MRAPPRLWALPIAGLLLAACEEAAREQAHFTLPSLLMEISGLAAAGDNSVFAHNDEFAIVHELSLSDGRPIRIFALGDPTIEGDFEGIAAASGMVYLVTSDGLIYAARPGADRERVAYRTHETGVGRLCEVEGLSNAPTTGHLLLLCKRLRRDGAGARLEIYRWPIGSEAAEPEPWLSLDLNEFLSDQDAAELRPSGLEWDARRGRLLVISARNNMLLELGENGDVLATHKLDARRHRRTEGIAVLPECRVALADEGAETRAARLTAYPCPA